MIESVKKSLNKFNVHINKMWNDSQCDSLSWWWWNKAWTKCRICNINSFLRFLNQENEVIIQNVNAAGILRVGGEYRFGNYSIRAGYIKQGATLKNFDNSSSTKSIGGGINFGGSSLDLSIVSSEFNGKQQLFSTGLTDNIDLKKDRFTVGLTYTLKL